MAGKLIPILLVHGTFANPDDSSDAPSWWKPGSSFCSALDKALSQRGSAARTWINISHPVNSPATFSIFGATATQGDAPFGLFHWTGANSERERRSASDGLRQIVMDLEEDPRIDGYFLVGHSHGGNVIWRAIRDLKITPSKLRQTIFLGTPFFGFADEGKTRNLLSRINWPTLMLFIFSLVLSYRYFGDLLDILHSIDYQIWIVIAVASAIFVYYYGLVVMLVNYFRYMWTPVRHVRGVNVVFPNDEAINLLVRCAQTVTRPHEAFYDIFASHGSTRPTAAEKIVSSLGRTPFLGRVLEVGAMSFITACLKPYRPPFRLFLSSRLRLLKTLFFYSAEETPVELGAFEQTSSLSGITALAAVAGPVASASMYLLILPFDILLGSIDWIIQVAERMFVWLGLRVAARSAFGIDLLGVGFRPTSVGKCPEFVTTLSLGDKVEERALNEIVSQDMLRRNLVSALGAQDSGSVVRAARQALSGAALLRSSYYRSNEVVLLIADLIASADHP